MNRITSLLLVSIISSLVLLSGCMNDEESGLTGTYSRMHQYGSVYYHVELQFASDGLLIWKPVDSIPGHNTSAVKYESIAYDRFRIFDDPDCGNEGIYAYSTNKDRLEIISVSDDCNPRKIAMSGCWGRK